MSVACRVDSACWAPGCLSTTLTEQERDSSQSTGAASRGFSSSSSSQTWWQFWFQTSGWEIPIIQDVASKELWLEREFKFRLVQTAPPKNTFSSCSEPAWHYGDNSGTDDWHVATLVKPAFFQRRFRGSWRQGKRREKEEACKVFKSVGERSVAEAATTNAKK